jgi:uncharacterized protein
MKNPFHLAIQVRDVEEARLFFVDHFGCSEGRRDDQWIDLNFFGHQLVCHLNAELNNSDEISIVKNSVDGFGVPVPHFGVILEMDQWQKLANRLKTKNFLFIIEPYIRFKGQSGEQATMFFSDPSGNAIEIKAFRNIDAQLFAK